jgi:hypothetical protein
MVNCTRRSRWLPSLLCFSSLIAIGALLMARPALATHPHPASATALSADLVEVAKRCGTTMNPANGQHGPPLGLGSCVPDGVKSSNGVHIGPAGTAHVDIQVAPPTGPCVGGPASTEDVCISIQATDMQTAAGLPYDPTPGQPGFDIAGIALVRIWDHYNCTPSPCAGPYTATGATTDLDFGPIPADCEAGGPGTGSTCSVKTSANAVVPGVVVAGKEANVQIFRIRVVQSDGSPPGNLLLQQGIYVP